jgi:exodeoxyribonuclease VII small subunit
MAQSSFEKDLEQLEAVVAALEEGGLSLDDALKRFEDGIKLARRCDKALTEAEKKIEMLVKNVDGTLEAKPFGDEEGPALEGEAAPAARTSVPAESVLPTADRAPGEEGEEGELLF